MCFTQLLFWKVMSQADVGTNSNFLCVCSCSQMQQVTCGLRTLFLPLFIMWAIKQMGVELSPRFVMVTTCLNTPPLYHVSDSIHSACHCCTQCHHQGILKSLPFSYYIMVSVLVQYSFYGLTFLTLNTLHVGSEIWGMKLGKLFYCFYCPPE